MQEKKYAKVTIRANNEVKPVRISSDFKPAISSEVIDKWQSLLDQAAKIMDVPAALIMKLNEGDIEVFLKNQNKENPYKRGEKEKLIHGLYCETVIGKQKSLIVPNATESPVWKDNNPDVDLNMISYMGLPINYPDGEVFGTVCVLDDKENHYSELYKVFLDSVKQHIETDLKLLVSNRELEQANEIKSKFLSLISHDVRGSVSSMDTYLKFILSRLPYFDKEQLQAKLETLSATTNSLYHTFNNLLTWSKQDLLQLEPQKEQVDLVATIDKILEFFKPQIQIKALKVQTNYSSNKIPLYADPNMLETALRNILSNAVKFTDSDGEIFIRAYSKGEQTTIEIEDTGLGMEKETLNNLFSYFQSKDNQGESAGLGLLLTKEFLDKNGASVKVSSERDKGTKFVVRI